MDGDTLGVDSSKVGVFEEGDEVSLGSFMDEATEVEDRPRHSKRYLKWPLLLRKSS